MRHDKRSLTFSESQVRQYFLSLLASANTGPGVIDFGLFFRSQVPRKRRASLFLDRIWKKSEIDLLYPHPPAILTLLISRPPRPHRSLSSSNSRSAEDACAAPRNVFIVSSGAQN